MSAITLQLDSGDWLRLTRINREHCPLVGDGWEASLEMFDSPEEAEAGEPDDARNRVHAFIVSRLDRSNGQWGIDSQWSGILPVHANGFGSPGCGRRVFTSQNVQDWLDTWAEVVNNTSGGAGGTDLEDLAGCVADLFRRRRLEAAGQFTLEV